VLHLERHVFAHRNRRLAAGNLGEVEKQVIATRAALDEPVVGLHHGNHAEFQRRVASSIEEVIFRGSRAGREGVFRLLLLAPAVRVRPRRRRRRRAFRLLARKRLLARLDLSSLLLGRQRNVHRRGLARAPVLAPRERHGAPQVQIPLARVPGELRVVEEEARVGGSARARRIVQSPADLADEPVRRRELLHSARLAAVYRAVRGISSSGLVRGLSAGAGTGHASILRRELFGGFPLGVPDEGDVRQPFLAGELVLDQVEGHDVPLAQARTRVRQVLPRKLVHLLRSQGGRRRRPRVVVFFVILRFFRLFRLSRRKVLTRDAYGDSPAVRVQFGAPS
jgi:hypothetical protein